jgi:hypothetical protein
MLYSFAEKALLNIFKQHTVLMEKYPGYQKIVEALVKEKEVIFPQTPEIEDALTTFPFIVNHGLVPKCVSVVRLTLDFHAFLESPLFQFICEEEIEKLERNAHELEVEALKKREQAKNLKNSIALRKHLSIDTTKSEK